MKRLLILDLDNTFYKYDSSHTSGLLSVFEKQNIFGSYEEFILAYEDVKDLVHREIPSSPSKHSKLIYFKRLFFHELDNFEILNLENLYWDSFIKNADLQEKGIRLLSSNKNNDNSYVLFTNQNLNTQLKKLHAWKLNFFENIVTSEEVGYEKPSLEFFKYVTPIIQGILKDGGEVFALGDSFQNDVDYWINNFDARGYLINNDLDEIKINDRYKEANFNNSLEDIFNLNSNSSI